jgi:Carboxypeptidase regulatory-like domain
MMRRYSFFLVLCLPFAMASPLYAQRSAKNDTVIEGVVLGADGKPVAAAAVTCQSSAGVQPRVVHTDSKGHYIVIGLKQDSYDLRASSKGAYSDWEKNIPVRKGQTKRINLRLLNGNTALSGTLPAKQKQ